jgi:glycosyltransferase involved in cell wall biosynthesis
MITRKYQKKIFISWFAFSSRNDNLAKYLNANLYHMGHYEKHRLVWAPLKYSIASFKTLFILAKEKPDVIFIQNPPIFAVLITWFYCIFNKSKYVVDTHSSAFTRRRWIFFQWLYRFLSKRALVNILHNEPLAHRVAGWQAPSITLTDPPPQSDTEHSFPYQQGFNVVFVCSYSEDEPVHEVVKAARSCPNINFFITGKIKHAPKELMRNLPKNIILTDFLQQNDYLALLKDSDTVISLTYDNFTMQCGAYEAMAFEKPIVTSDWPVLKKYFSKGTVHIDNTAESIVKAIYKIKNNYTYYHKQIAILRKERVVTWNNEFNKLITLLKNSSS